MLCLQRSVSLSVRSNRPTRRTSVVSSESRSGRLAELGRLGMRRSASSAAHRAHRSLVGAGRRAEIDAVHQRRAAEDVASTLGRMRGAAAKVGQIMSTIGSQSSGDSLRAALTSLQSDAPGMPAQVAADVVQAELGGLVNSLFARFERNPVAAASIGQVHRACTREGDEVAVKIQYPGIDRAMASDAVNSRFLLRILGMVFRGIDTGALADEVGERLSEELDYCHEAGNQMQFADFYRGHPFIRVPEVIARLSTERVLTTEWVPDARFSAAARWDQAARDRAGEIIFRFVLGSIFRLHVCHSDPHPGNMLFGQETVTFLDFGMVRPLGPMEVLGADALLSAVCRGDVDGMRPFAELMGVLPAGEAASGKEIQSFLEGFGTLLHEPGRRRIGPDDAAALLKHSLTFGGAGGQFSKSVNVAPSLVLLQRINLGVVSLLAELGATADWQAVAMEYLPSIAAPPSTPLGHLESEWAGARR